MLDMMVGPQARAGGWVRAEIRGHWVAGRVAGQQGQGEQLRRSQSLWTVPKHKAGGGQHRHRGVLQGPWLPVGSTETRGSTEM